MQTDPNTPGVEKVCCTSVIPDWLTGKKANFTIEDLDLEGLIPPQKLFMVKGWNRSVCMLGVLLAAFEVPAILEVGQPYYYLDICNILDLDVSFVELELQRLPIKLVMGSNRQAMPPEVKGWPCKHLVFCWLMQ